MDQRLTERLNQLPEKMLDSNFLSGRGLGNEVRFWIFKYQPEHELGVRQYVDFLQNMFSKKHTHLKVVTINLLECLAGYLKERNFFDKVENMQKTKGDEFLLKALKGPLHMDKFAPYLLSAYKAEEQDIVLITGVGSVFPLIKAHDLLNSLHAPLGHKPLIMFYPGEYDGQHLCLFDKMKSKNYYRAFPLFP